MSEAGDPAAAQSPASRRHLTVVSEAAPEPPVRGASVLCVLERPFLALERWSARALPLSMDPIAQSGAVANFTFLVAAISGVLLLFWYVPSVHQAWDSLEAMRAQPFGAELVRSLHRYSSDACMLFVLLHAVRYAAGGRFAGPRWLAWVTGVAAIGVIWLVGWLGYWLVWDERARQVALGTARAIDVVPVFTDPLSSSFVSDASVNTLLFFVVFFVHMLLPLLMVVAIWLHVSRLSRGRWMTGWRLSAWIVAALVLLSLLMPATSAPRARMIEDPGAFGMDYWYLAPLVLTDRLSGGALWALVLIGGVVGFAMPWYLARGRAAVAEVATPRCNACEKCSIDCPYGAITMVPRTDGAQYATQAEVDPSSCVGCGVCAGSCDSSAVGVPWLGAVEARSALDDWIEAAQKDGGGAQVAFVCATSAAAGFSIDPKTGRSADLPGWLVWAMPCAGWLHPLTIERVFRHGASGVLVAACGETSCAFREGGRWTDERIAGQREPKLRADHVDRDRVWVVHRDRGEPAALRAEAERLRAGAAPPPRRVPSRARTIGVGLAIAAVATGVTAAGSDLYYAPPSIGAPELVVSFKLPGRTGERCREPTPEEIERTPQHMRRDRICERGRAPVRLRVSVDGEPAHRAEYPAFGLFGDGPSAAVVTVPVSSGSHRVEVALGDSLDPDEWTHVEERELDLGEAERRVVRFEPSLGFVWE